MVMNRNIKRHEAYIFDTEKIKTEFGTSYTRKTIVGIGANYNYMPKKEKKDNQNSKTNTVPPINRNKIRIPKKGSNAYKRFIRNYGKYEWVQKILKQRNY